jgi:hypothetical protein
MKEHQLIVVPFHEDRIYLINHEGEPYVPIRPIIENLGLSWSPQHLKLKADSERWGVTILVTPSPGGPQETICLPLRKVPAFLNTIDPHKCREAIRPKLRLYQNESDDALWRYWTEGYVSRIDYDRLAASLPPLAYTKPDPAALNEARRQGAWAAARLIMQCEKRTNGDFVAAIRMANKIIRYRRLGLSKQETALLTGISTGQLQTMEGELRECGYGLPRIKAAEIPAVFPRPDDGRREVAP